MTQEAARRPAARFCGTNEQRSGRRFATIVLAGCLLAAAQALAQIPEAPGDIEEPDGMVEDPVEITPRREKAKPKSNEPAPDPARDTIEEMERARERASGTPLPEPTPAGLNGTD